MSEIANIDRIKTSQFGVYIHWPYCERICPYCDFNVFKNKGELDPRWRTALLGDLSYWAERVGRREINKHIFRGRHAVPLSSKPGRRHHKRVRTPLAVIA